jgi:hypothetical protein
MLKIIKECLISLSDFSIYIFAAGIFLIFKSAYLLYLDLEYQLNFVLGFSLCCLSCFMTFLGFYLINKENKSYKKLSLVEFYSMLYTFTSFQRHGEWKVEKVKNGWEICVYINNDRKRLMFIDDDGKNSEGLAKFISVCPDYMIRLFDSYLSECACEECVEVVEEVKK